MSSSLRVTSNDSEWSPKYYGVIVGLFCGIYMISTAISLKIIVLGPFIISAGLLVVPLCTIITDILTEIYGFNRTRQAIWTVLVCIILFSFFSQIAVMLPPASFWPHQEAYTTIFSATPRIALAGCLAWLTGEFLNSYVMSKMKIFQNAKNTSLRFIGSTIIAQFADTIVFMLVAFGGAMPWEAFVKMALIAWIAKILYEVFALPLSLSATKKLKQMEGIEHFDKQKISLV
ncbi:MAG TPA: transporter [Rhodospirillaceae bacterium]|nr:transporter [Rhodospirillaceae bacterium]